MKAGTPEYFASLKADAIAGKLFQAATIAYLLKYIEQQKTAPITADRLRVALACHIDLDQPPGMAANQLARVVLELLEGVANNKPAGAMFALERSLKDLIEP